MSSEIAALPFDTLPSPPYRPLTGACLQGLGGAMIILGVVLLTAISFLVMGGMVVLLLVFIPCFIGLCLVGVVLFTRGRQMRALPAAELLRRDPRPPVLFLRSFDDDDLIDPTPRMVPMGDWFPRRYEEALARALRAVGPMIAIGRPGEKLALLGAGRVFVPDHAWRAAVEHLSATASAVVLMVGRSKGVWWEIESSLRLVPRQRLLFFFPYVEEAARRRSLWQRFFHYRPANAPLVRQPFLRMEQERQARFALFRERMQPHLSQPLPETIEHALFIDFQPNGHPRALITTRPWWWPMAILTPSVQRMLSNMERTLSPFVEKLRNP